MISNILHGLLVIWLVVGLIGGGYLLTAGEVNEPVRTYTEEPHNLEDGMPCTIIQEGTHSGMVGITCNYGDGGLEKKYVVHMVQVVQEN